NGCNTCARATRPGATCHAPPGGQGANPEARESGTAESDRRSPPFGGRPDGTCRRGRPPQGHCAQPEVLVRGRALRGRPQALRGGHRCAQRHGRAGRGRSLCPGRDHREADQAAWRGSGHRLHGTPATPFPLMRIPLLFFPLLLAGSLLAQQPPSGRWRARRYVDTLAGPAMFGRGDVNGGDSLAAEWIAKQFDRIGLAKLNDQRFEPFTFPVNSFPDSASLRVDGTLLVPGIDFLVDPASGSSDGTYNLVHLNLEDLATPERKAMTMGVVVGHAAVLHFPPSTNGDTLALYNALQGELSRY